MTAWGDTLFGISVVPLAAAHHDIVAQVLAAERGVLDLVAIAARSRLERISNPGS